MNPISVTVLACLTVAPALMAQGPPNACGLLTTAEIDRLINRGKSVTGMPEAILAPGGKGSVCDYPGGAQIVVYPGPDSRANFERILTAFGVSEKDKTPVSGIGDKAYMFYRRSTNPVEHGAYLVMTVGAYTIMTQVAAHVGAAEVNVYGGIYCRSPDVSPSDKEECARILADKTEPAEAAGPAAQELGKVVAAKVRAGKF